MTFATGREFWREISVMWEIFSHDLKYRIIFGDNEEHFVEKLGARRRAGK